MDLEKIQLHPYVVGAKLFKHREIEEVLFGGG